jgi:hypothetical protein
MQKKPEPLHCDSGFFFRKRQKDKEIPRNFAAEKHKSKI